MTKQEILKILNKYAIDKNEKPVINIINLLIQDGKLDEFKDLFFMFISSTQFYGYIEYLKQEQKNEFLIFDLFRSSSYKGVNINYYNRGQLSLLNEMQENNKVFISAPTSFGKTSLIMELILENRCQLNNILMILPTNSLIEELFLKFHKINYDYMLDYHISTQPKYHSKIKNLLILTPERYLVLAEDINISSFDLIIMDETYKIVDFNNPTISDFVNRRSYRFRRVADMIGKSNSKVLFLSPYTYKMDESMKHFFEKHSIKNIVRRMDYVSHKIIPIIYSKDFLNTFGIRGYRKGFTIKEKVSYILEALGNDKTIVYVGNYSAAYEIVDSISNRIMCLEERFIKFLAHMKENYTIKGTPTWKVVEGLEKGVGIYISPLPRYVKKEIVKLYEVGVLRTMIVTTAFTEGINTDAEHLIISTLKNGPNTNELTNLDLLNAVGRAGRFAKESVGKVYCITKKIYDKIVDVKSAEEIELSNKNYEEDKGHIRNDFEIDMMDNEYLNELEIERKTLLYTKMLELGLTKEKLDISLNVSNAWKLELYEKFTSLEIKDVELIKTIVGCLVSEEGSRLEGIEYIFRFIRDTIKRVGDPFPQEIYEIRPFDKEGGFTWGRMYGLYSSFTTKVMIQKNMEYIINRIESLRKSYSFDISYKHFERLMHSRNMGWICRYINDDFSPRYDRFYTEAFKFISSIIQYKIPYYISFFVSTFKLFLIENNLFTDFADEIDLNDIVTIFENNNSKDEYSILIDFGISNDILMKLSKNKIGVNQLSQIDDFEFLDDYEKLMIKDISRYL